MKKEEEICLSGDMIENSEDSHIVYVKEEHKTSELEIGKCEVLYENDDNINCIINKEDVTITCEEDNIIHIEASSIKKETEEEEEEENKHSFKSTEVIIPSDFKSKFSQDIFSNEQETLKQESCSESSTVNCKYTDSYETRREIICKSEEATLNLTENVDNNKEAFAEHRSLIIKQGDYHFCTVCNKYLYNQKQIYDHRIKHNITVSEYICDICHKTFPNYHSLNGHTRVHSGIKKISCYECQKSFTKNRYLKVHLLTHQNPKEFKSENPKEFICNVCNKSFGHRKYLIYHLALHSGFKKHICKICGVSFNLKSKYDNHYRNHFQTKKAKKYFKCLICFKRYQRKYSFDYHSCIIKNEEEEFKVFRSKDQKFYCKY